MDSRKQIFVSGNIHGALNVWRKEESMFWNEFGKFLSGRADEIFAREGVVRKVFRIEGDYKIRKRITVSGEVWDQLSQSRNLAKLGWDAFFLWLLERRHFETLPEREAPVIGTRLSDMALDRRERSPRVPGCLKNRYGAVVFYLGPEAFRQMEKWRRHGRWDDLDERLEALILGVSLPSDPVRDEGVVEETIIPPAPIVDSPPTGAEFALLRSQWLIEAKRWEKRPSETRAWPDGALVRVIERGETYFEEKMRRVEAVFIYELKDSDDLNILKPYRLDFSIEAAMEPGSPARIEPEAFKFRSLSFRTFEEMMEGFENRETIFYSLEKEGR